MPAAVMRLNMTQNIPPIIGSGTVIKRAPHFESKPKQSINMAAA